MAFENFRPKWRIVYYQSALSPAHVQGAMHRVWEAEKQSMAPKLARSLRALVNLLSTSLSYPRLSAQLMRQQPAVIRGRRYGSAWAQRQAHDEAACTGDVVNPLEAFFNSRETGKGIWKWTHYFDAYHRHLQKFIGKEVYVLEVGVYSGGSLEMWKEYFGARCHVYGVDIKEECRALEGGSTRIFVGDQADRAFWKRFRQEVPILDVLIDDGGHQPEQQIVTLEEMLPHLRPGGVFVCEDVHGDFNEFGAYVRGLSANLDMSSQTIKPGPGKHLSSEAEFFQADIHSIHSYPYMTVIEKRIRPIGQFSAPCRGTEWAWPATKPVVSNKR